VGEGGTYAKLDGPLSYRGFIEAIRAGRSYVSDGRSHLLDFRVDGTELGTRGGEARLDRAGVVRVSLQAAAWLKAAPDDDLRSRPPTEKPYWDLRRARRARAGRCRSRWSSTGGRWLGGPWSQTGRCGRWSSTSRSKLS